MSNRELLKNCNALVKWNHMDRWMAGWQNGDEWLSPAGIRISEPDEHKPATLEEILNYYEQEKLFAIDGIPLKS